MRPAALFLAFAFVCAADEYRDAALKRATESVQSATEKAAKDPSRPIYHFCPPALWMNDPNGTIFHNGYYHVFYQHNPYGDVWGHMHWGHARSKDLVHWEHLPIALWPSEDKGEAHCFSGCARINGDGVPMLFYTSVSTDDKKRPNEQWAAIGDKDLIKWDKHPANPILNLKAMGLDFGPDWRDPFIFSAKGRTFLVCGADTKDEAIIPIFEATTPQLDKWQYKGILYRQPKSAVQFFECPNFFPLENKWVLIFSPYKPLQYIVGSFDVDSLAFTPEKQGTLDYGTFYASNIFQIMPTRIPIDDVTSVKTDPEKPRDSAPSTSLPKATLVGWVRGFKEGMGWNGCMSLPRKLSFDADGFLTQSPPDLRKFSITDPTFQMSSRSGDTSTTGITNTAMLRLGLWLKDEKPVTIKLTAKNSPLNPIVIEVTPDVVRLDNIEAHWPTGPQSDNVTLTIYVDRSVIELFAAPGGKYEKSNISITKIIDLAPNGFDVTGSPGNEVPGIGPNISLRSIWQN